MWPCDPSVKKVSKFPVFEFLGWTGLRQRSPSVEVGFGQFAEGNSGGTTSVLIFFFFNFSLIYRFADPFQINSFIIEDTCAETTVENFIPHPETNSIVQVLNYNDLMNRNLENVLLMPIDPNPNSGNVFVWTASIQYQKSLIDMILTVKNKKENIFQVSNTCQRTITKMRSKLKKKP